MVRVVIGSILGGLAQFVIGFLFWHTPLSNLALRGVDDATSATIQRALAQTLTAHGTGTYAIPSAATQQGTVLYGQGPVATIHFNLGGFPAIDGSALIAGVVLSILTALLIGLALFSVAGVVTRFEARAKLVLLFAAAAVLYLEIGQPIFNHYDWAYFLYSGVCDFLGLAAASLGSRAGSCRTLHHPRARSCSAARAPASAEGIGMTRAATARLMLAAALLLAALLGWWSATPPPPLPATSAPDAFAAARALPDIRAAFARPHPIGSDENLRTRAYLAARMAALGLLVARRSGAAAKMDVKSGGVRWFEGANVVNLVGVIPGHDRAAPALCVMAHYDSVPSSSGAADDGAGVSAALEMARAIGAIGPPARDVLIVLTDGEEAGLLGARAFFERDPLAAHVGMVVNMDVRGDAGRAILYETGRDPGGLARLYARSATHPTTDSIASFVKKLIRNNSDFAIAAEHGKPGVNFAFIGNQFDYHAASSTPARLDPGTLQHLGEEAWAMVRPLAYGIWPKAAPDLAYASVLGLFTIVYPMWAGWLIVVGAALLAGLAWRTSAVPAREMLRGMGVAAFLLVVVLLGFEAARALAGVPFGFTEVRPLLARWPMFEGALGLIGLGAALAAFALAMRGGAVARMLAAGVPAAVAIASLAAGATIGALWWWPLGLGVAAAGLGALCFARPLAEEAAVLGLALLVLVLAALAQALAPQANVLLSWAALGAALFAWGSARWEGQGALALVTLGGALLAAEIGAMAHLLLLTVGENMPEAVAPFALLIAACLAAPLARSSRGIGLAAAVALGTAAALLLVIRWTDYASPARPRATQALYLADTGSWRFWRISNLASIDRWTDRVLRADGGVPRPATLQPSYARGTIAPARAIRAHPPGIAIARSDRGLLLTITPAAPARELRLWLKASTAIRAVRVEGLAAPYRPRAGEAFAIAWAAPGAALHIAIEPAGHGALGGRIATLADGWPVDAKPLPPRGPDEMPWYNADSTITWSPLALRF